MDNPTAELVAARSGLRHCAMDGLTLDGAALALLAAAYGTPLFVYGGDSLAGRVQRLAAALRGLDARICYAVKANDHLAILDLLARLGVGADVVSGGELARALAAGVAPGGIVFSGVGKTRDEIEMAIGTGVDQINLESAEELAMVQQVAAALGRTANVALRVNPNVDAGTHDKISTGRAGDKFGIDWTEAAALYRHASGLANVRPVGLAVHIGSQIRSMAPFRSAYGRLAEMVAGLRAEGFTVGRVDAGGGLGIDHQGEGEGLPEALAGVLRAAFGGMGLELTIEPGRWLVGPIGVLVSRVVRVKQGAPRPCVILDAGMNDLVRPALYDAWHGIVPLSPRQARAACEAADVAGPVCESSDMFARARPLPALAEGDLVALLDCGAYGAVMSSTYNARPLAAQMMVRDGQARLIRPRQTPAELWRDEVVPDWRTERAA